MTAAARPRRLLDVLMKRHDEAVKARPFSHFVIFLAITAIFANLVYHIGITEHEPLIAVVPCVLAGFAARDAWGAYKVWKSHSNGGDEEKKNLRRSHLSPVKNQPPTQREPPIFASMSGACCLVQAVVKKAKGG